ncbi:retrotransposon protein, putative, ty1-copia subclass [Tanacetum coccineum]
MENLHVQGRRAGKIQKKNKKPSKAAKGVQGKGKGTKAYAYAEPSYVPKPKNPPPPKKDNPAKDAICHHCGKVGHWRRNCPICHRVAEKRSSYSRASTFTSLRGSKILNPGALSLYMGNGQHAAVEAIGNYHLCLPSGLVIVLNNCHYAPSITRGIISVSRLYEDGFINRFEFNNAISVSKNNIQIVSNKRAKLNLDYALLWHCHLGHISKNCIQKLQHDGLLDSTDIKSFEKCVACMSGNMARKPYSHQVERAKDLLGLIHTDGCEALVKRDTLTKPDKLEPRAFKCIFVGYPKETMGYSFYYPPENKVFVARNAKFFENDVIDHVAGGSLEDLEIIQEEDTHPSLDTSLNHEEDDQEIDEPQSDINPIRRSTRTRRPTDRLCLYVDAEEHELGDLGEPANYKAALLNPESDKWLNAMNVEMQSMKDNEV